MRGGSSRRGGVWASEECVQCRENRDGRTLWTHSQIPRMAAIGVRISCEMVVKNEVLSWFASRAASSDAASFALSSRDFCSAWSASFRSVTSTQTMMQPVMAL